MNDQIHKLYGDMVKKYADLQPEHEKRACPCLYGKPCHERCTCIMPLSSSGCMNCCAYGSLEQRQAKAKGLKTDLQRKPSETISDKKIEKEAPYLFVPRSVFIQGAKWMRDNLPPKESITNVEIEKKANDFLEGIVDKGYMHDFARHKFKDELIDLLRDNLTSQSKETGKCSVDTCRRDKYEEDGEISEFCLKHIVKPPERIT